MVHAEYSADMVTKVRVLYVVAICVWIAMIYYLQMWHHVGWYVLLIPFAMFGLALWAAPSLSEETEEHMTTATYLSMGILLAIPLFTWMNTSYGGDKQYFMSVTAIALVLSLFTYYDLWIPVNYISLYRHTRSILQTGSVTLFIYALVHFYLHRKHAGSV